MIKKILCLTSLCLIVIFGTSLESDAEETKMMKTDEIKPGMKGYGKTVFEGTKIEKFDIEVIGVWKNVWPKQDMILIRCKHHILDKTGIISGMSGSPIYIVGDFEKEPEGKLIGALAYGWGFTKESIAGVTPIENMLKELKKPLEKSSYRDIESPNQKFAGRPGTEFALGQIRPLRTPLFVSGVNPRRMKQLEKALEPFGLIPIQAGKAMGEIKKKVSKELQPGSALGVNLVRGDEDWTAIGTVTYRDGNKLLAFGHPFGLFGEISLPVTTAYVYGVLPRLSGSFKLSSSVEEVGALTQDRLSCVAGLMGKKVKMAPVRISVENLRTGIKQDFSYEIVHHKILLPRLVFWLMWDSIDATEPTWESAMVEVATTIKIKGFDPVTFRRLVSGSPFSAGWRSVDDLFWSLWANPFVKIEMEDLSFDLKVLNENRSALIQKVWLDKSEVKPGESVRLNVWLKPYRKPITSTTISFVIPKDTPDQDIDLTVCGADRVAPSLPPPANLAEFINYLKSYYDSNNLVTIVPRHFIDFRYKGKNFSRLPNSILSIWINQMRKREIVITSGSGRGPTLIETVQLARETMRVFTPTNYVIEGSWSVPLKIRKYKQ